MAGSEIPNTGWIWIPSWNKRDEEDAAFVYFRKVLELETVPEEFCVKVSADSRYKLYINSKFVEAGPSKGDGQIWFYDEIDIAPYLHEGKNVLSAIVLRYPLDHNKGNHGIFRTKMPGFYLQSCDMQESGTPILQADDSWKCKRETKIHIVSENPFFAPLQIFERAEGNQDIFGWMWESYCDEMWETPKCYSIASVSKNSSPGNLQPRTIPFLTRKERNFCEVSKLDEQGLGVQKWQSFLQGKSDIKIPAQTSTWVEISAGELMTGYLKLCMYGGKGTEISILQSECYAGEPVGDANSFAYHPLKGDRTDAVNGKLYGFADDYVVGGFGSDQQLEIYEPFWFRTFRFIRLSITTKDEPIVLKGISYEETGYPLQIRSQVKTSDDSLDGIWDICARTLQRCMHETYEDCPFYEQLQYAMDSRSQILYTYAAAADDRLARKCMDDFRRSRRYDGMINCSYPNFGTNVIPGFAIYYISMLVDHMMYFGDRELIKYHMPAVDEILEYFNSNLNEKGLVKKIGGLNRPDNYWSFIDWTKEWDGTSGVPSATLQGPITMESLLYLLGLQHAAQLCDYVGRSSVAEEYRQRSAAVQRAIQCNCHGRNGMYQDGPGIEEYSQHCQVFAILTGTLSTEEGKGLLKETLEHKEDYAQCSVAMMFYLFRALEKCGMYDETDKLWDYWRDMLAKHMTTCAEDPVSSRSDCHAWGALALYELPAAILGVRPVQPGCEVIQIDPVPGVLTWAEGTAVTPKGDVYVKWIKEDHDLQLQIKCPVDMEIVVPEKYTRVEILRV